MTKFTNMRWTKIIKIGVSTASTVILCLLQDDYDYMEADPLPARKAQKKPWELLYDPELLLEEHGELLLENFVLSDE